MPLSDWWRHRQAGSTGTKTKRTVPGGIWSKCAHCGHTIFQKDVLGNHQVCPECSHHFPLSPNERVALLLDDGSFKSMHDELRPQDPLEFAGRKPYRQTLSEATKATGEHEAVLTGRGAIDGIPVGFAAMDFGYIAGSMGSVVGEKITRLFETAMAEELPVIIIVSSGGARMQEGMLSLLQMAKTTAAADRHSRAGLLYISVLANPTTGGVLASFASLADVILAEPNALIGFAGPRVIQQTLQEALPKGFQQAETVFRHGMIDMIVPRAEMRSKLSSLVRYLA